MANMLNTAVSGLLSFQRALGTTSHNIANVNTEGYSRQSVEISANVPTYYGGSFVGTGAHLDALEEFHPDRMAGRILGQGDMLSLIETAQQAFDQAELQRQEQDNQGKSKVGTCSAKPTRIQSALLPQP